MKNFLCLKVRKMRFFRTIKQSNEFKAIVHANPSLPFFAAFNPTHAKVSAFGSFLWSSLVVSILRCCHVPKVGDSVVIPNAVNMINNTVWQHSVHEEPCKPVREESLTVQSYLNVPVSIAASSHRPSFHSFANVDVPRKYASILVVVELFTKLTKIEIVHAVAPSCSGLESDGSVLTHRAVAPL